MNSVFYQVTLELQVPEGTTAEALHEELCYALHEGDYNDVEAIIDQVVDVHMPRIVLERPL